MCWGDNGDGQLGIGQHIHTTKCKPADKPSVGNQPSLCYALLDNGDVVS